MIDCSPTRRSWPSSAGCPWRRSPMPRSSRHCSPCRRRRSLAPRRDGGGRKFSSFLS